MKLSETTSSLHFSNFSIRSANGIYVLCDHLIVYSAFPFVFPIQHESLTAPIGIMRHSGSCRSRLAFVVISACYGVVALPAHFSSLPYSHSCLNLVTRSSWLLATEAKQTEPPGSDAAPSALAPLLLNSQMLRSSFLQLHHSTSTT